MGLTYNDGRQNKLAYILNATSFPVTSAAGEARTQTTKTIGGVEISPNTVFFLDATDAVTYAAFITHQANNDIAACANTAGGSAASMDLRYIGD